MKLIRNLLIIVPFLAIIPAFGMQKDEPKDKQYILLKKSEKAEEQVRLDKKLLSLSPVLAQFFSDEKAQAGAGSKEYKEGYLDLSKSDLSFHDLQNLVALMHIQWQWNNWSLKITQPELGSLLIAQIKKLTFDDIYGLIDQAKQWELIGIANILEYYFAQNFDFSNASQIKNFKSYPIDQQLQWLTIAHPKHWKTVLHLFRDLQEQCKDGELKSLFNASVETFAISLANSIGALLLDPELENIENNKEFYFFSSIFRQQLIKSSQIQKLKEKAPLTIQQDMPHSAISLSNGGIAFLSHDTEIRVWDLKKGKEISTCKGSFSSICEIDNSRIASLSLRGSLLKIWDIQTGKEILSMKGDWDRIVPLENNMVALYSSFAHSTIYIVDINEGKIVSECKSEESYLSFVIKLDAKRLVSCSPNTLSIWDINTGKKLQEHKEARGSITSLIEIDYTLFFSMDWSPGVIRIWNTQKKNVQGLYNQNYVNNLIKLDNDQIACLQGDRNVLICNTKTGVVTKIINEYNSSSLVRFNDQHVIYVSGNKISLLNVFTKKLNEIGKVPYTSYPYSLVQLDNCHIAAVCRYQSIQILFLPEFASIKQLLLRIKKESSLARNIACLQFLNDSGLGKIALQKYKQRLIKEANAEICSICQDAKVNTKTACNHEFCNDCLLEWTKTKDTCPLCRAKLIK